MNKEKLFLFVLDFSTGRAHRYRLSSNAENHSRIDSELIEAYLISKGHSLGNCEYMTTQNPILEY